jgi:ABC-2 type transport system ATP-binding protein
MHVKAENLYKEFSGKIVVEDLSFNIRGGTVLGILGPKGAGKTTALRMILNTILPDGGAIEYDERSMTSSVRNAIGYLPQERGLYHNLPLHNILVYFARLKNVTRKKARVEAVRLLDRFGLIEQMDAPFSQLHEEMQQKVIIMIAIVHNPDLLILDEPFTGFDYNNYRLIHQLIRHFQEEGKTIILTSDQLIEAETLCTEAILVDEGKTILQGNVRQLHKKYDDHFILVEAADNLQSLGRIHGVRKLVQEKQIARLYLEEKVSPQKVLDAIVKSVNISRVEINQPNLNDIYLEMVSKGKAGGE